MAAELWMATFVNSKSVPEPREASLATSVVTSFELFPRLPGELQDEIWALAAHLDFDSTAFIRSLFAWRCTQQDPWHRIEWEQSEPILVLPLRRRMRGIPLFWVCRAARRAAIKAYGDPQKGNIIFNPSVDSVHVVPLGDDSESDYDDRDVKLIGPDGSDAFETANLYSDTGGIRYTIARCPLSNNDSLSRELYQYTEPYELEVEPFRRSRADHRFYGISKCLQRRVRHVCVSLAIHKMIQTFSSCGPVARGLEATMERFPGVESVTIYLGRTRNTLEIFQRVPELDLASMDAPEWWTHFILTLAGAERPLRLPEGLKRVHFARWP